MYRIKYLTDVEAMDSADVEPVSAADLCDRLIGAGEANAAVRTALVYPVPLLVSFPYRLGAARRRTIGGRDKRLKSAIKVV